jgi:hypothetical protein
MFAFMFCGVHVYRAGGVAWPGTAPGTARGRTGAGTSAAVLLVAPRLQLVPNLLFVCDGLYKHAAPKQSVGGGGGGRL